MAHLVATRKAKGRPPAALCLSATVYSQCPYRHPPDHSAQVTSPRPRCTGHRDCLTLTHRELELCELPCANRPAASENTISTRRFCCRPDCVSFDATGKSLPRPFAS